MQPLTRLSVRRSRAKRTMPSPSFALGPLHCKRAPLLTSASVRYALRVSIQSPKPPRLDPNLRQPLQSSALDDAHLELHPETGEPQRVVWPDGWTSSSEWIGRLDSLPQQLPALPETPVRTPVPSRVPGWVKSTTTMPTISAAPTRLLAPEDVSLSVGEERLLLGRPVAERQKYAELVKMVALETGCADTRSAVTRLLEAEPSPLWHSTSASGFTLLDEVYDLAMVVRMRSGAQAIDQPRLLREVIQEIENPKLMAQHATPSCLITSIFQFGMLKGNRSAEYVRQVRDLAARGTVFLPSGVRLEASENWLEEGSDYRTQSLKLVASAYYARTYLSDPDRVVADSLVYKSTTENELFEWFLGEPMQLVAIRTADEAAARMPDDVPPYVASVVYTNDSSRHAVTVLRVNSDTVEFLNPWGRVETATTAEFLGQLWKVSRPSKSQVKPGKPYALEHSTRKGGVVDWESLSRHEQADALLAYGRWKVHDLAKAIGLSPTETDAISDFRCALAIVDRAQGSVERVVTEQLAQLPRLVYREWASTSDSMTRHKRDLVEWRESSNHLQLLRAGPAPSNEDLYRFAETLITKSVYFWRPLMRGDLLGAETPIFDKAPDSLNTKMDGTFTDFLVWLEQEQLLGAICRMETPFLKQHAEEESRHQRLWGGGEIDINDFKRAFRRQYPKLCDFVESYVQAGETGHEKGA
jgi:hypothetical protein